MQRSDPKGAFYAMLYSRFAPTSKVNANKCLQSQQLCLYLSTQNKKIMLLSNKFKDLNTEQLLNHKDFRYARYKKYGHCEGYQLYFKCDESPTGVECVRGISVEEYKKHGESKQTLSPTELIQSAR